MSIKTDLASLEILAKVYQNDNLKHTFEEVVRTLPETVSYIDWVGIYLHRGNELQLEAATSDETDYSWETNSELKISIGNKIGKDSMNKEIGKIVVRSKQPICFDITDLSTLEILAGEISQRIHTN